MNKEFEMPNFSDGEVELRVKEDEVMIYASEEGLNKLMGFCKSLVDKPSKGHIHLEDFAILTSKSLKGTIAIFPSK